MDVLTTKEVNERLLAWLDGFETHAQAASRVGIARSQLSQALQGKIPVPPKILEALKISRAPLYVAVRAVPSRYLA